MILLDLFCGAGGCSEGYNQAGFEVYGIDLNPQKHYPFPFLRMDAVESMDTLINGGKLFFPSKVLTLKDITAIHSSPPCQRDSTMTRGLWKDRVEQHPNLIPPMHVLLNRTGKPYIIENVEGARNKLINPIMLCGTMFNLQTKHGSQLRRHRYFEVPWFNGTVPKCNHIKRSREQNGKRIPDTVGVYGHAGGSSTRDNIVMFNTEDWKDAMGINWMNGEELAESIPPAYTKFIGEQLKRYLNEV
jgi:DNA (cytosine-5)-methyltransferase 1